MCVSRKSCIFMGLVAFFGHLIYCHKLAIPFYQWRNSMPKKMFFNNGLDAKLKANKSETDFIIKTPGCYIPNYESKLKYVTDEINNEFRETDPCGKRAVFVDYIEKNKIRFRIDREIMVHYTKKQFKCCYKFIYKLMKKSKTKSQTNTIFTKCEPFETGTTTELDHEIVSVSCVQFKEKKEKEIYNDAYILVKKAKIYSNVAGWNVLILGIHSMSRARLKGTMPRTFKYLKEQEWSDYRGFQKIGSSTFPNIMGMLTGRNNTFLKLNCYNRLSHCEDHFIWNRFRNSGYKTAYAEDYVDLPNTFIKQGGFTIDPTDHFMQSFFELGEKRLNRVMCMRRSPSATHLLKYAEYFVNTYAKNKFFGMFWINSYSHGSRSNPSILDEELVRWLSKQIEMLDNTFIFLLSDHGTRYGEMKIPIESYYEERLPMLFIWTPNKFKNKYPQYYGHLNGNQQNLITPYDLYTTLGHILKLSDGSKKSLHSKGCPQCSSLLKGKPRRWTCADARVSENGCSCRVLEPIGLGTIQTKRSIDICIAFINNHTNTVSTIPCMACKKLSLSNVIRSHVFYNSYRVYNVIAFELSNGVNFEATVIHSTEDRRILDLHTITSAINNGSCVLDQSDRPYCDCEAVDCGSENDIPEFSDRFSTSTTNY